MKKSSRLILSVAIFSTALLPTIVDSTPTTWGGDDCLCTFMTPQGKDDGCTDATLPLQYSCDACTAELANNSKSMYEKCMMQMRQLQPHCHDMMLSDFQITPCSKMNGFLTGTVLALLITGTVTFICIVGTVCCWKFACLCFQPTVSYVPLSQPDPGMQPPKNYQSTDNNGSSINSNNDHVLMINAPPRLYHQPINSEAGSFQKQELDFPPHPVFDNPTGSISVRPPILQPPPGYRNNYGSNVTSSNVTGANVSRSILGSSVCNSIVISGNQIPSNDPH